ncbi:MAG: hypothetical protein VKL39_10930 [Leptolyngbyaceae bacterium]|nr:hypothetical protein [Leptolyngbyaceae bacterium]
MQTEFEFTLPKGYLDAQGNVHRRGIMRLSTAMDEIVPLRDPRVRANPAYATVIILARVITHLGALDEITPTTIEGLFACDLNFLQQFYRHINELEEETSGDRHNTPKEPTINSIPEAMGAIA